LGFNRNRGVRTHGVSCCLKLLRAVSSVIATIPLDHQPANYSTSATARPGPVAHKIPQMPFTLRASGPETEWRNERNREAVEWLTVVVSETAKRLFTPPERAATQFEAERATSIAIMMSARQATRLNDMA